MALLYYDHFVAIIHDNLCYPAFPCYNLDGFVGAKIYYPHAIADGNHFTWIRGKMLEFSSVVILTLISIPFETVSHLVNKLVSKHAVFGMLAY